MVGQGAQAGTTVPASWQRSPSTCSAARRSGVPPPAEVATPAPPRPAAPAGDAPSAAPAKATAAAAAPAAPARPTVAAAAHPAPAAPERAGPVPGVGHARHRGAAGLRLLLRAGVPDPRRRGAQGPARPRRRDLPEQGLRRLPRRHRRGRHRPELSGGEAALTFPDPADHKKWVQTGSAPFAGQPYGDPQRKGGQHRALGGMPAFGNLSPEELDAIVQYEREKL